MMRMICLFCAVHTATSLMTGAERLERRRQSKAYKRAMSNINLQFIAGFLAEQPPTDPTVKGRVRDFDLSGLGDESHFSLLWWLPGVVLGLLALALYVALGKPSTLGYSHHPAKHPGNIII